MPYDKFSELIKNNDPSALDYFSMQEAAGVIHFATYKETVITVNGVETDRTYILTENVMSYKSVTNLCSMPTNFLFNLLQESENPEYVMAVVDLLLKDTELVVMIQDQMNINTLTYVETYYNVEKTVEDRFVRRGGENTAPNHVGSTTDYNYPAGDAQIITTVITTYTNTVTAFIQDAKTWCLDFAQEALPNHTYIPGEHIETTYDYSEGDFENLGYTLVSSSEPDKSSSSYTIISEYVSSEPLIYSKVEWTDVEDFGWDINVTTEKRINYERFLGLWKNDTGEYYLDCQYDENGKLVRISYARRTRCVSISCKRYATGTGTKYRRTSRITCNTL